MPDDGNSHSVLKDISNRQIFGGPRLELRKQKDLLVTDRQLPGGYYLEDDPFGRNFH